ncbi:guanine nucleotide-binding protein subunit gamma 3 isoform X3 [Phaseolus vulgaris]|uniref:guanine nucleotide-binding protein subunit gamma 3 isoform X3 n=1 Tax=Phaseolus vulgaris TaxID=3885 RepID=UPI0035CAC1AF
MLGRGNREKKLMGGSENEGKLVWSGVVEEWRPKQNHFSFLRSGHVRSEEELKSVEGLQPASRCCKEVADYVMANPDPLLPTTKKNRRSCRFWKWLCGMPCFNLSWICCCCCCCEGLSLPLKLPRCCGDCKPCSCSCSCLPSIKCCSLPKWSCCCSCPKSYFCKESCGFGNCCTLPRSCNFGYPTCPSCPSCCSCKCTCTCSCPSCPKVSSCCCCTKSCWRPCCLCC